MRLNDLHTDAAVLHEIGRRIARQRLERNLTQADLAREAGLGLATVQRLERGSSVQMKSIVRVLRALGLLEGLDSAVPESVRLPIAQLEREQRATRRRASGGEGGPQPHKSTWTWGDESDDVP